MGNLSVGHICGITLNEHSTLRKTPEIATESRGNPVKKDGVIGRCFLRWRGHNAWMWNVFHKIGEPEAVSKRSTVKDRNRDPLWASGSGGRGVLLRSRRNHIACYRNAALHWLNGIVLEQVHI